MKKLPDKLKEKQEKTRQESIHRVQQAIDDIKAEGYIVTTKLLMEHTGFARSTFSKEHIQEILKQNQVCKYANTKQIKKELSEKEKIKELEKELITAHKKIQKLESEAKDNKNRENELKVKLNELSEANKILRGQLHVLIQKAKIKGLDIDI